MIAPLALRSGRLRPLTHDPARVHVFKFGESMKTNWNRIQLHVALALTVFCSVLLTACLKSNTPASAVESIPVPVHGVNYTSEPFSFIVIDPHDPKNYGGGETINSYGAGGTMCCYSLPVRWRPGLKVEIAETYWLPMKADKSVPEIKKKHMVEIPPYQGGKAGELWVLREAGGEMTVVSSDVQPDHQSWPGKVKGWPVPSIEHRRELQDRAVAEAQMRIDLYVSSLDELSKEPGKHGLEEWNSIMMFQPARLKQYKGSGDPAYMVMLKKDYENKLASARDDFKNIKAARP